MSSTWGIAALNSKHIKTAFDCGEAALNNYLQQFASQHAKSKVSKTFVATSLDESEKVIGFYTLSAGSIAFNHLPDELQKKLPRYPIPVARIGRLAIDKSVQKQGLGKHLLMDALYRCARLTEEIGITGVVVDAKHEKAKLFYQQYGFTELSNLPLTLFTPIQTIILSLKK